MSFNVFLSGASLHTSLGFGLEEHANELRSPSADLLALPNKIKLPIQLADEDAPEEIPYHLVARKPLKDTETRYFEILEKVVENCLSTSGLSEEELSHTGLYLGTSSSDVCLIEQNYLDELKNDENAQPLNLYCSMDNLGAHLRKKFNLSPLGMSANTACTASANALLYAAAAIKSGRLKHAIIVGAEILNITTAYGFQGLELLTQTRMRPFDARRDGLVLGEAASAVILSAQKPSFASIELLGGATLSDGYGMSAANPDGSSIARVIRQALKQSNVSAEDINAIKAHGTASLLNDEGESEGLKQVFQTLPTITALKPYIGHTFGASGLTELLILNACLDAGFIPGTPGISEQACSKLGITLNQTSQNMENPVILCNQFGFGGNNTSLVVRYG
ncbi:beta-ketoacyl synthase N-terminal-like domain-containing protein [Hirschia maritima]|uniref:beta-ketoacyl synthase N-terminal-like domain-containing protein n=1 Tax=Hirschia maritima TaxID=1121961 RepID=UPI00038279AC|nr:beta-ketoacyl synthase N-terminal-like domain-containing protein [Hirschia maritima]